ncbi:MAG: universal stress protein [Bacteroidetes bacterium]|nr:universal stress protein [Bacteroidota bacterium]
MKNILVLTDFSKSAASAAEAGLLLAGKMHTDLLLYNSYINYQTIASYGGGGWIVDEYSERKDKSRVGLDSLIEGLESLSSQLDPEDRKPVIYAESDDNDLAMELRELIKTKNIEMIVMGARSDASDDYMFGADTNAVIGYTTRPVLITPAGTELRNQHRIVFATDFEDADMEAIHYIARIAKSFYYKVDIVHVSDASTTGCDEKEKEFQTRLARVKYLGMEYHLIKGKDVIDELNQFIDDIPGTILAMVHVQNSFLMRLFQHSMVKKALADQKAPLLIFPSK